VEFPWEREPLEISPCQSLWQKGGKWGWITARNVQHIPRSRILEGAERLEGELGSS